MGTPEKKVGFGYLLRLLPILFGFLVIFYFSLPIITQNRVIGPFDFLVNFYHPYKDLPWEKTPELYAQFTKPKNYLMSDVVGVVFPMKYYSVESLKNGVIPLWNRAILNGAPHLANTQSSALNPFNIFFVLFGYLQGFNIFILFQLILALLGMYLFLRSLTLSNGLSALGGLSFAFSGYMVVWLPWGTIGYAYAMLPWALYLLNRNYWLSVIPLALSFYSGHIQTTFIISVFFYAYALYSKIRLRKIIAHSILFLLLSAPQLLPTLQLFKYSGRTLVSGDGFYLGQSLPFHHLIASFAPDVFGNPVTRNWWGHNNYAETVSFAGTLFAFLGIINLWHIGHSVWKKTSIHKGLVFFVGAGLVSIILSVQSPLLFLLYKFNIPVFSTSTFSRNLSIMVFSGIVGGAMLIADIQRQKVTRKALLGGVGSTIILLVIAWLVALIILPNSTTVESAMTAKRNLILPTALSIVYAVCFLAVHFRFSKKLALIVLVCVFSLQTIDMMRFAQKYTPFSPHEFFYPKTALGEFIGNNLKHKTYLNLIDANHANIVGGESLGGSDPLFLKEYAELTTSNKDGKPSITDRTGVPVEKGPYHMRIINILGAQYLIDKNRFFQNFWQDENPNKIFENEFPKVWADEIYQVFFNKFASPDFYVVTSDKMIVKEPGISVLSTILNPSFAPKQEVVVSEVDSTISPRIATGNNKVAPSVIEAHRQVISVQSTMSALLVNNQTYYPNWSAVLDGKRTQLLKVNHVLQGVQVPAGTHTVEFVYEDRLFVVGCALWILGSIFFANRIITTMAPKKIIRSFKRTLS